MRLPDLNRSCLRAIEATVPHCGKVESAESSKHHHLSRILSFAAVLLLCSCTAYAEDPCATPKPRALVLGGGGIKGAFEAGAAYHLVAHRKCDFNEFSGVSVGSLNAAFLGQARRSTDVRDSYASLLDQTEALVSLWQSLKSSHDIARRRPLATLRFGVLGLDSLVDFSPLRRIEDKNILLDRLAAGRPVRIGVVSFYDGEYREILVNELLSDGDELKFRDYLSASSTPPVLGRLVRIPEPEESEPQQYADGSLRHITPVDSYFNACQPSLLAQNALVSGRGAPVENCSARQLLAPEHELVQQLFVIATSPYNRDSDSRPVLDPKCCPAGTRQITDGRKILGRTLALLDDEIYRRDLDLLLFANDALAWRWHVYEQLIRGAPPGETGEIIQGLRGAGGFAFESYNRDPEYPNAPSRPYEVGLIVPEKEFADLRSLLTISPEGIEDQLYCGCVAADRMMQVEFGLTAMTDQCAARFPRSVRSSRSLSPAVTQRDQSVCRAITHPESRPGTSMTAAAARN